MSKTFGKVTHIRSERKVDGEGNTKDRRTWITVFTTEGQEETFAIELDYPNIAPIGTFIGIAHNKNNKAEFIYNYTMSESHYAMPGLISFVASMPVLLAMMAALPCVPFGLILTIFGLDEGGTGPLIAGLILLIFPVFLWLIGRRTFDWFLSRGHKKNRPIFEAHGDHFSEKIQDSIIKRRELIDAI